MNTVNYSWINKITKVNKNIYYINGSKLMKNEKEGERTILINDFPLLAYN